MRRMVKVVVGATLIVSMLTGITACGKKDDSGASGNSGKKTITVLSHRTDLADTLFKDYEKAFEASHDGVDVVFQTYKDYGEDVKKMVNAGEYGDVLMIPDAIKQAKFQDYLEPLGTVDELSEKYEKSYLYAKQKDGTVYGLSSGMNAVGLVYNKKVFTDAGITIMPRTPEEFLSALQAIKDKTDAIPYYTNYHDTWALTQWNTCANGMLGDATWANNVFPNTENPFSEGQPYYIIFKTIYDIVEKGLCEEDPTTTDWEGSKLKLNKGEIGCMALGMWAVSQMKDADVKNADNIGYMPFPYTAADGNTYCTVASDYCYAVSKNSENKDLAKEFVEYMVNESGYPESQGMGSIVKGSTILGMDKANLGYDPIFVVDEPATAENEGKTDALKKGSEINIEGDTDLAQTDIIDTAMGQSDYKDFDAICDELNEKWNAALSDY